MNTITYLWKNRVKHPILSYMWFKVWGKRLARFGDLLNIIYYQHKLCKKGASIGYLSIATKVELNGKAINLSIGEFTYIGKVHIALHDRCQVGNYVVINDGVQILTASHDVHNPMWSTIKSPIIIDDYAWIATNAMILPGITIGKGAVVGAGAVVSKDVPPYTIVAGNPAKIVSERVKEFNYSPVAFNAPYESWLGK